MTMTRRTTRRTDDDEDEEEGDDEEDSDDDDLTATEDAEVAPEAGVNPSPEDGGDGPRTDRAG